MAKKKRTVRARSFLGGLGGIAKPAMSGAAWGIGQPLVGKLLSYVNVGAPTDMHYLAASALGKMFFRNKWVGLIMDGGITVSTYNITKGYTSGLFGNGTTTNSSVGAQTYVIG